MSLARDRVEKYKKYDRVIVLGAVSEWSNVPLC